ncbi:MAG: cystathionine beta-lyase [Candidatus Symbiobacter sp.]|nr:cystathionine beta-lyase [Candidatus Symbiobacter sp.]
MDKPPSPANAATATLLVTSGRNPHDHQGVVNPPVYHASTIIFPNLAEFEAAEHGTHPGPTYGRRGTETQRSLEATIAALNGGEETLALPSGLAAMVVTLLAFLERGDHALVTDAVYKPVRRLCNGMLQRMGIEVTYFDPTLDAAGLEQLFRPETKLVWAESPGSLTFEMSDIPAFAQICQKHRAKLAIDNTWATGLYFKAFDHGVDLVTEAATKYLVGHSDAMVGAVTARGDDMQRVRKVADELGYHIAPDDCYLALRGMRSLAARLPHHYATGLKLAEFLAARPEIKRVIHPARRDHPGHALWRRDYLGASGLFAAVLHPVAHEALAAFTDGLELFGMGYSWGGYESLVIPCRPAAIRTAVPWQDEGMLLRFHAGLEDIGDLTADLTAGFARMKAAG